MSCQTSLIIGILGLLLISGPGIAQDPEQVQPLDKSEEIFIFVDEDGDGFNDLAPDADGDGIPNDLDPDYIVSPNSDSKATTTSSLFSIINNGFGSQNKSSHGFGNNLGFGPINDCGPGQSSGENQNHNNNGNGNGNGGGRR
jgi:hypothetical protein